MRLSARLAARMTWRELAGCYGLQCAMALARAARDRHILRREEYRLRAYILARRAARAAFRARPDLQRATARAGR